jgi:hypothetical protein
MKKVRFSDERKKAKMRWEQDPSQSTVRIINNVSRGASGYIREKRRNI